MTLFSHGEAFADITVVGIGADGWDGLLPGSRAAIDQAQVLVGSPRQLDLIPPGAAERVVLPSPLLPNLAALLDSLAGRAVCVLASGDPLFYGIGSTLVRLLGAERVRVLPHPSSVSLACARLGWPVEQVEVVSAVGRPLAALRAVLAPGRRVLVLGSSEEAVRKLVDPGSRLTVLTDLGAPDPRPDSGLRIVAVECPASMPSLPRVPGLPDEAFEHDGQLTKREVRAVSLSRLAPLPGQMLWDVGAGAGSIAVEWMRAHPSCRAVAIESRADRAERIGRNAETLGVPALEVVIGRAPEALQGLPEPDAIFIGGGVTVPGLVEACWSALRPGGRLVANAVTLESEALMAQWYGRLGGDLVRLDVQRASPLGSFTGWRPAMPVTVWTVGKEDS
ncbi:precorrin-6y C5,15-methyltransferase (decarboxylating) subunit CbiE [Nonomuraea sp. NPDC050663]|uniref:precorrin-6y C5,15-methyltransferase (decarboxylating) subunit CbiE n=1 Tax=Nonomuraea sp. NPDC050663 TaxID=3364370 RepID=UPI003791F483